MLEIRLLKQNVLLYKHLATVYFIIKLADSDTLFSKTQTFLLIFCLKTIISDFDSLNPSSSVHVRLLIVEISSSRQNVTDIQFCDKGETV